MQSTCHYLLLLLLLLFSRHTSVSQTGADNSSHQSSPVTEAGIHLDAMPVLVARYANIPAFSRHFTKARLLLVVVSRRFESTASSVRPNMLLCARKEIYFHCICITLVILMYAFTHLTTLLLYAGHQFMHCTVMLCVQCSVKLCCLFWSWFSKEANVANNNND